MIEPSFLFSLANAAALLGWVALAVALFSTRWRNPLLFAAGRALPPAFAVLYVGALAAGLSGAAGGGFGSIGEVRALFANDHALLAGWLHYLAFDLFVGAWIVRRAVEARLHPALVLPLLALTFLFGPAGFLAFIVVRAAATPRRQESLT